MSAAILRGSLFSPRVLNAPFYGRGSESVNADPVSRYRVSRPVARNNRLGTLLPNICRVTLNLRLVSADCTGKTAFVCRLLNIGRKEPQGSTPRAAHTRCLAPIQR